MFLIFHIGIRSTWGGEDGLDQQSKDINSPAGEDHRICPWCQDKFVDGDALWSHSLWTQEEGHAPDDWKERITEEFDARYPEYKRWRASGRNKRRRSAATAASPTTDTAAPPMVKEEPTDEGGAPLPPALAAAPGRPHYNSREDPLYKQTNISEL